MKPIRTLVLVAGEESARFFLNQGVGKGLSEVCDISISQFAAAQVDYSDRPGRQTGGPGGVARHGFDPHDSADEQERGRFARHVVEALAQQWSAGKFDRLVVAAPAKMLGVLRGQIKGAPAAALHADLAKDLVNVPLHDLPGHFTGVLSI
ncbi:host attachment family protein [Defluviimonas sp. SAOS-178_SWC]|uniref:host attachment family protein n=1 Tax=Defluviimonas sp. SAOS-178_SWC TaxID=3121287 RepID=UPI003221F7BA